MKKQLISSLKSPQTLALGEGCDTSLNCSSVLLTILLEAAPRLPTTSNRTWSSLTPSPSEPPLTYSIWIRRCRRPGTRTRVRVRVRIQ